MDTRKRVTGHFEEKVWVCISEAFDLKVLAAKIIEGLGDIVPQTVIQWETLQKQLCKSLKDKMIFLVLDDVWLEHRDTWEDIKLALNHCSIGSRIIVTTRSEVVSITVGSSYKHNLAVLNDDDCWSLFKSHAFNGIGENDRPKLEDIGRKISDKCKGVPLFTKSLGCLMPYKKTLRDWQDVLASDLWGLPTVNKDVLPPLLLSYNALPPHLRRCFAYCAVFIKDYTLRKDHLIKQWMSHGFIISSPNRDLEIIGREYFADLVSRSFFQDLGTTPFSGVTCKMHDLMHDLASFVSNNECSVVEGVNTEFDFAKTRHLSLTLTIPNNESTPKPLSIRNPNNLRTLLVLLPHVFLKPQLDILMLHQLKCLRSLSLAKTEIRTLPNEIGNLIHLRYLDLSYTDLMELPGFVSNLINLQTLKLNDCGSLRQLPQGLAKLTRLRHLENNFTWNLKCLPQGLGRLKQLQTLSKFVVSEGGCQLQELGDLNNLHGFLRIEEIKGVLKEAGEAKFKNKQHPDGLQLMFVEQDYEEKSVDDTRFLELLEPHPNLEGLRIFYYGGSTFPTWIERPRKIFSLSILYCHNLKALPSFISLESLESLELGTLDSIVSPMSLFTSIEASTAVAYPNLKILDISNMKHWEEWEMETVGDTLVMPLLQNLSILSCPKLKSLPNQFLSDSVTEIWIENCPELTISYLPPLLEKLSIGGDVGSLARSLPFENNTCLKYLQITDSPHSTLPKCVSQLKALQKFEIWDCEFWKCIDDDLQHLTSLRHLDILRCPILEGDWSILSHIDAIWIDNKRIR